MAQNWWRGLTRRWLHCPRRRDRRPRLPRLPLRLEQLEDRVLPTTMTWTNPQGGDWDTASNWSSGKVPTSADDVVIPQQGITITHGANVSDAVNSLTSAANLSLSAGSLAVGGGISSSAGTFTIGSGTTLSLSGSFAIASGAALTDAGTITVNTGAVLNNSGTITDTSSAAISLAGTAKLNNLPGGLFDIQAAGTVIQMTGTSSGRFENYGTVRRDGPSGTATVSSNFDNLGGMFDVEAGALTMQARTSGSSTYQGGTFTVAAGSVFDLTGGGTVSASGTLTGSGAGTVQLASGTLQPGSTTPVLSFPGGLFQWTGGTLGSSGGTVNVGPLGTVNLVGGTGGTVVGTLNDYGTIIQTSTVKWTLSFSTLTVQTGGLYDLQSDAGLAGAGNQITVLFGGTLRKSAGSGTSSVAPTLNNSQGGTVQVASGTLSLGAPAAYSSGTLGSGTWSISNATLTFPSGDNITSIGGAASVTINGAGASFSALPSTSSVLTSVSGTLNLQNGASVSTTAGLTNFGIIHLGAGSTLTVSGYTSTSGTLDIDLGGAAAGQYGVLAVSGTADLSGTALNQLLVNGFTPSAGQSFAIVTGSVSKPFAAVNFQSVVGVGFTSSGGGLSVQATTTDTWIGGSGSQADWSLGGNWSTGAVPGPTSDVVISNGAPQVAQNTQLPAYYNINSLTMQSGTSLSLVNGGKLSIAAASALASVTISTGTLRGGGNLTVSGSLNWTSGDMSGFGSLTILSGGSMSLSPGGVTTLGRPLINQGTFTLATTNGLTADTGPNGVSLGSFVNQGTFNGTSTGVVGVPFVNQAGGIVNASASMRISATSAAFTNAGTVNVTGSGITLSVLDPGSSSGTYTIGSGATLSLHAAHTFTAGSSVTGAGTLEFDIGGPYTFAGSYTVTTTNIANNGITAYFDMASVSFPSLSMAFNATLGGSAAMIIPAGGTFIWSNGTLDAGANLTVAPGGTLAITGGITLSGNVYNQGTTNYSTTSTAFGGGALFNMAGGSLVGQAAGTFNPVLGNSGTVQVNSGTFTLGGTMLQVYGSTLTGGTWVVSGGSTLKISSAGNLTTNDGNITLSGAGSTFTNLQLGTNNGSFTLLAQTLTLSAAFSNPGTVIVGSGGSLTLSGTVSQVSGGTLTGGTWDVAGGGTLSISSAGGLTTNAASVILSGAGSAFPNLANLATNTGSFTITGGQNFATGSSTFSTAGTVTIGAGSSLAGPSGGLAYAQTAGATVIQGTLDPNTVSLQGGSLSGSGTVAANVTNSGGTVYPGGSGAVGILTISGSYTQSTGGSLSLDLGGTAAGQFDVLSVSGGASLGGALTVGLVGGYQPGTGVNTFGVLTSASATGDFTTKSLNVGAVGSGTYAQQGSGTTTYTVFTVSGQTPVVTVSDPSGPYTGQPYTAMATVAGVVTGGDNTPSPTLEGVGLTLTYYAGSSATGTPLSGAPTNVGTYTVVASFPGSAGYTSASARTTFSISPVTITWINAAGGDWDNASNWLDATNNSHRVPGPNDYVVINQTGITITHSQAVSDAVQTLTSAANLSLSAGSLALGAGLSGLSGGFSIGSGATLNVSGTLAIASGSTFTDAGGSVNIEDGGVLDNSGTVLDTNPTAIRLYGAGQVTNEAAAAFDIQSTGVAVQLAGGNLTGRFENYGTIDANPGGTGSVTLASYFDNLGGTIQVDSGSLAIGGSAALSSTEQNGSAFVIAPGAVLYLADASTATLSGTLTGIGTGTVELGATATDAINVAAAGAALNTSNFLWAGGSINGPGNLTNAAGSSLTANGSGMTLFGTLTNQGTVTQQGTAGFTVATGGVFNNAGTDDLALSVSTTAISGGGSINNSGLIDQSSNQSVSIASSVSNTGTVEVDAGSLTLSGAVSQVSGSTLTGGTWDVTGGTLVIGSAGNLATNAGSVTLSGAGSAFSNLANLATNTGSFTVSGGQTFATGSSTFGNAGTVTIGAGSSLAGPAAGLAYTQTAGSTAVQGALDASTLSLQGGGLSGSGTVAANVSNSGGTVYPGGNGTVGTLTVAGTYAQSAGGTLSLDLGGTAAGQFDVLSIAGGASLGGTLSVGLGNGYQPGTGVYTFGVIASASATGDFATRNFSVGNIGSGTYAQQGNGSTTYTVFTVSGQTPTVTVSDPNGVYTGQPFTATATVTGVVPGGDNTPAATLEGVGLTLTYYAGSSATGTPLSGAPTNIGTYTVVASFPGSAGYIAASAQTTFTISPVTVTWINPAGGDWDTADNWLDTATNTHHVPGANDIAVISQTGITITHSVNVSDTVNAVSCVANLSLSTGSLSLGNGTSTLTGTLTVSGGTVTLLSGATFNNGGTINYLNSGPIFASDAAALNNEAAGLFNIEAANTIFLPVGSGSAEFNNFGTLRMSGPTGTATITNLDNVGGTIDVETGTLAVEAGGSGGTFYQGGTYETAAGATLDLTGGRTATVSGTLIGAGSPVNGTTGAVTLDDGGKLVVAASGASFDFGGSQFQWRWGTLDASAGTLTNTGGAGMSITTTSFHILKGTLDNADTITVASANGQLALNTGAVLNNELGGTFALQAGNATVTVGTSPSGVFENYGTVDANPGSGASAGITTPFDNLGGTIRVDSGTFAVGGSAGSSTEQDGSTFNVAQGAVFYLAGGSTATVSGTLTGTGAGTVELGDFSFDTLAVAAAGATIDMSNFLWAAGSITGPGTLTNAAGSTFNLNGPVLKLSAGLTNQGTITVLGTSSLTASQGPIENTGILNVQTGTLSLVGSLAVDGSGAVTGLPGSTLAVTGNFTGATTNADQFAPQATVNLNGSGTATSPQLLEVMGQDLGGTAAGFSTNFVYTELTLSGSTHVQLVDNSPNTTSGSPEALYVNALIVPAGTTLDLHGLHLYTRQAQIAGTLLNGTVVQLAAAGPLPFNSPTPGDLTTTGQLDDWTFFARQGQVVQIKVNTGAGAAVPPLQPYLNNAQVTLLDASGNVVAQAATTSAGADVVFPAVTIPADGVYHLPVQGTGGATGHYTIAAWCPTVQNKSLIPGDAAAGRLQTPYRVDTWTFVGPAGESFELIPSAATSAGIAFTVTDPNGNVILNSWSASNGPTSFTLPSSGAYVVTVFSTSAQPGTYGFTLQEATQTALTLNTPCTGMFVGSGEAQLFTVSVTAGQQLALTLQDGAAADRNELYVQLGSAPTAAAYQFRSSGATASPQVIVPSTAAGTYYILVYSPSVTAANNAFTLLATTSPILTGVTPDHYSTSGDADLTLSGSGFDNTTTVSLVAANGTVYALANVQLDSGTQMRGTVAAGSVPAGVYSVEVTGGGGGTAERRNAFTLIQGGPAGSIRTNLIVPSGLGLHQPATLYVQYSNPGDTAIPAPLLTLDVTQLNTSGVPVSQALLTLDPTLIQAGWATGLYAGTSALPAGFSHSIQILAGGKTPGVLEPGESVQVPVYWAGWQRPWNFFYPPFNFSLGVLQADDTTPTDWSSLQTTLRPTTISTAAWGPIFANLTAHLGNTSGSYVQALDADASYLAQLGEKVTDVGTLWAFEIQQAIGFSVVQTVASAVDATVPAPGPALRFTRSLANSIQGRYQTGPLGYGWFTSWQTSLSTGPDGSVAINGPAGSRRLFEPNSRGGYLAQTGDHATLTAPTAGNLDYILREQDGSITAFLPDGSIDYVADTNGNRVSAGYNSSNQLISLTTSSGQYLTIGYNAAGLIASITDSANRTTTYAYDPTNQYLLSVTGFDGRKTSYTYDTSVGTATSNALLSVTYPDGAHEYLTYDSQGRLSTSANDGGADRLSYTYGPAGTVSVTDATGDTSEEFFNEQGLIVRTQDPRGHSTEYSYDSSFHLIQVTGPTGLVASFQYDARGNVVASTDPNGNTLHFTYTSNLNQLASYTDAKGNTTAYRYSTQGNLLAVTYADGSVEQFSYDPLGNLTGSVNRRGQAIGYTYDSSGEVTRQTLPDGSRTDYTYDGNGNLTTAVQTNADGTTATTALTYDPVTEDLIQITYPDGRFLRFTYDAGGRRIQSVDQDGFTVNYQYDSVGRLSGLTDGSGNPIVSYTYDADGRLTEKDLGNGTYTTDQYDAAGELLHLINHGPRPAPNRDGPVNSQFDYTYDALGHPATETTIDGQWVYSYDGTGQLIHAVFAPNSANPDGLTAQDLQYFYDPAGNRTQTIINGVTTTYTINSLNEYTRVGSTAYLYDADGNLISSTSGGGATTHYNYNALNKLVAVTSPSGTWSYQYDVLGNRDAVTQDGATSQYLIDPVGLGNVVGVYRGKSGTRFTYGIGLTSQVGAGGTAYFDFDALGSTVGITSAAGSYLGRYSYVPFGGTLSQTSGGSNPFTFAGAFGVSSDGSGLLNMRARNYDLATAQFTSQDPSGLAAGDTNLRRYVGNAPILSTDPTGLMDFAELEAAGYALREAMNLGGPGAAQLGEQIAAGTAGTIAIQAGLLKAQVLESASVAQARINSTFLVDLLRSRIVDPTAFRYSFQLVGQARFVPAQVLVAFGFGVAVGTIFNYGILSPGDRLLIGKFLYEAATGQPVNSDEDFDRPPTGKAFQRGKGGSGTATAVASHDPNDAIGPGGFGPQGFLAARALLPYRIDFENQSTATAPAQQVLVTDELDPSLDWSTLQFTEFGFGGNVFSIPVGVQDYEATVPMTYNGETFNVDIRLVLDPATGLITALFQSVGAGGLPPDVLTGFLPPEDGTGRGMGYFAYTIVPRAGLPTGTQIRNVAIVTFDDNPPIATDQVDDNDPTKGIDPNKQDLNTIDAGPPTSSVSPLPATETSTSFTVSWSGQDDAGGSGIASYNIYVSDDGGPFTLFQQDTTATSATFTGQNGHTYAFYSVATDNVGNQEATPTAAEATTTVRTLTVSQVTIPGPNPRTTPVGTASAPVTVTFSEPINLSTFTAAALTLTDDGVTVPLSSIGVSQVGNTDSYQVTGLDGATTATGAYVLTVDAGRIQDAAGNTGSGTGQVTWTTVVAAATNVAIAPTGSGSVTVVSSTHSDADTGAVTLTGTLLQPGLTVDVFDTSTNTDLGDATTTANSFSSGLNLAEGDHVLRLRAFDADGHADTSFDVLVDLTSPTSQVGTMPVRQSSDTFTVPVTFSDPAGGGGAVASGVASVDLYVATNGGPFTLYKTLPANSATSGSLSFPFGGSDRNTYSFHSVAHDVAGNTENKSSTLIEASTYVPDLNPPVTHALTASPAYSWSPFPASIFGGLTASSYANGIFTLNWAGADPDQPAGGCIAALSVYVQIDGGTPSLVGSVTPSSPTAVTAGGTTYSVYSGSMTYNALGDGQAHTYGFYSVGTDDLRNSQAAPSAADVTFTGIRYIAPLSATLSVEKGLAERSYIRYLDVSFNQTVSTSYQMQALQNGLAGSQAAGYIELLWWGENLTAASTSQGSVNLFGAGTTAQVTLGGSVLSIDFGAGGITSLLTETNVSGTGSPKTTFGDGWYALAVDPYGDPSKRIVLWLPFFRLLGDVNGDGQVTGPTTSTGTDAYLVNQARGQSGSLLNADVNGDGAVNSTDLQEAVAAANTHDKVGSTAPQTFPQFQLLSGPSGSGPVAVLTETQAQAVLPQAIAAWQSAGLDTAGAQALWHVQVQVANLGTNILGLEDPGVIRLNRTAAGWGWDVTGGSVSLLTVLEHELGHALDLGDNAVPGDLMDITLAPGAYRTPTPADVARTGQADLTVTLTATPAVPAAGPMAVSVSAVELLATGAPLDPADCSVGQFSAAERPFGTILYQGNDAGAALVAGEGDELVIGDDGRDRLVGGFASGPVADGAVSSVTDELGAWALVRDAAFSQPRDGVGPDWLWFGDPIHDDSGGAALLA